MLSRRVPDPTKLSGGNFQRDSVVTEQWTCRAEIPDPLAAGDGGPKIVVEATLYGKDVLDAKMRERCRDTTGAPVDSAEFRRCTETSWDQYRAEHRHDEQFRIRLHLRSTFSENSLDTKFWNIYIKNDDDIAMEPERVAMDEPVIVRRDSLPKPGRPPVRAGLYTRNIDLYFARETAFGARPLDGAQRLRLFVSRERRDLAVFTWRFGETDAERRRRMDF